MSQSNDAGERPLQGRERTSSATTSARAGRASQAKKKPNPELPPWKRALLRTFRRLVEVALLLSGLVATAVVAGVVTFSLAVRTNEMTVPELGGASIARAAEVLANQELKLIQEGNRFHDSVPADFIVTQDPPAGSILKKGRSVRVWLSLGPSRRAVPRIEGESLQTAQLILEQAGLALGRVVEITSDTYAPDTVIAQSPEPYEKAGDETRVSILLSRGYMASAYVMPDFVGRDYADLLDIFSRGTLRVAEIKYADFPGVAKDIVVQQSPTAGTKVYKRDKIVLHLAKGSL